jgi:hypothetical protein
LNIPTNYIENIEFFVSSYEVLHAGEFFKLFVIDGPNTDRINVDI